MTPNNTSSAAIFLQQQQPNVTPSEILFLDFAQFLLDSAGISDLPIPLDHLRKHLNLTRHAHPLPQNRGFLLGDTIFINADDHETVQRFTEAHEIMETLVTELRPLVPTPARLLFDRDKENWCERGAAELLMPGKLFYPLIKQQSVSLQTARQITQLCQTSLTATIRRMLDSDVSSCIFALLQEGHKKKQVVPSRMGQEVLWGEPSDWDPPAELRVMRHWKSPQTKTLLIKNESFARTSNAYEVFHSGIPGETKIAQEYLDLEKIKGTYTTEAMLVTINGIPTVMILIHL